MQGRMFAAALTLAAAAGCGVAGAAAPGTKLFGGDELPPEAAYFIGYWGIGGADECTDRDTMAFYASGAWAVTNGGGNPVEAIGVWSFAGDALTVEYSDLRDPASTEAESFPVQKEGEDLFSLDMNGRPEQLHRCR